MTNAELNVPSKMFAEQETIENGCFRPSEEFEPPRYTVGICSSSMEYNDRRMAGKSASEISQSPQYLRLDTKKRLYGGPADRRIK